MIYYHGSRTSAMSSFKIGWSSNNPLGPGIYLSRPVVADCHASIRALESYPNLVYGDSWS